MLKYVWPELRHSVQWARVEAVKEFGFSERESRFLVHVLVFSGVFLERQYRAFMGLAHGQQTHNFLTSLVERGYATAIAPGARHRGRFYHVHYKPLYQAIREPDNRHRRAASLGRVVERMMLLDAVLGDGRHAWLGTEHDKRAYFRAALDTDLPDRWYPHVRSGAALRQPGVSFQRSCQSASRWRPAGDTSSCTWRRARSRWAFASSSSATSIS